MIKELMTKIDMEIIPASTTLLFVTIFVIITLWAYRRGGEKSFEKVSSLPLDDGKTDK